MSNERFAVYLKTKKTDMLNNNKDNPKKREETCLTKISDF